jgi:Fic family protein
MLLSQSDEQSYRFYSMSTQILKERNSYYEILEKTQKGGMNITRYLEWFLNSLLNAIEYSNVILEKIIYKHYFWMKNSKLNLNNRQIKVLNMLMDDKICVSNELAWLKEQDFATEQRVYNNL